MPVGLKFKHLANLLVVLAIRDFMGILLGSVLYLDLGGMFLLLARVSFLFVISFLFLFFPSLPLPFLPSF